MIEQLFDSILEEPSKVNVSAYYDYIQDHGNEIQKNYCTFIKSCLDKRFLESKDLFLKNKKMWFPDLYINDYAWFSFSKFHEFIVHCGELSFYYKYGMLVDVRCKYYYWRYHGSKLCDLYPIRRLRLIDKHPYHSTELKSYAFFEEDNISKAYHTSHVLPEDWFSLLTKGVKNKTNQVYKYPSLELAMDDLHQSALSWAKTGVKNEKNFLR